MSERSVALVTTIRGRVHPTPKMRTVPGRLTDLEERVEALEQLVLAQDEVISRQDRMLDQMIDLFGGIGVLFEGIRYVRMLDAPPAPKGAVVPTATSCR